MALRLFNTLSAKVEEFRPQEDHLVRMYSCGPTVYDYGHMGNFRTFVFVDILFGGVAGVIKAGQQPEAIPLVLLLGGLAMTVVLAMSGPSIIAGVGLLYLKQWARVLTIILSVIHLFSVPFGTALGIYGLWVLLQRETQPLFRRA